MISHETSSNDPHAVRVLAAVISDDGRFLVCQRPADKRHGGLWEFQGGKLEQGESLLMAARRELAEELGVRVVEVYVPLFIVVDLSSPFVIGFVPTIIEGSPTCLEHTDLAWLTLGELSLLNLARRDRRFVEHLAAEQLNVANRNAR